MYKPFESLKKEKIKPIAPSWSSTPPEIPFDLDAYDFRNFAKEELKNEMSDKNIVNTLSNIKRSIDCRIDSIYFVYGLKDKIDNENWNFPRKKKFLEETGIVAPSILRKINKKRNYLEHDFELPSKEEVIDFLDVCNLFLNYTDLFVKKDFHRFIVEISSLTSKSLDGNELVCSPEIDLAFDRDNKCFKLEVMNFNDDDFSIHEQTISLEERENDYIWLIKKFITWIIQV